MIDALYFSHIFFKLINFIALISLLGYLIKKKILPHVYESILSQERQKISYYTKVDNLIAEKEKLYQLFEKEQQEEENLKKKVAFWAAMIDVHTAQHTNNQLVLRTALQERMKAKRDSHAALRMHHESMSAILQEAQHELATIFASTQAGQHYVSRVVLYMDKESLYDPQQT